MKTSKIVASAIFGLFTAFTASAQNNNVGIGTTAPDASAALEVTSTNQGFLPPRMTEAQRDLMPVAPATTIAEGLVIYCTDCGDGELQVYNGTAWTKTVTTLMPELKYVSQQFAVTIPGSNQNTFFRQNIHHFFVIAEPNYYIVSGGYTGKVVIPGGGIGGGISVDVLPLTTIPRDIVDGLGQQYMVTVINTYQLSQDYEFTLITVQMKNATVTIDPVVLPGF